MPGPVRLIVAITGASGSIYGIRALQLLQSAGVETHLVISKWGARTLQHETGWALKDVQGLAHTVHNPSDEGAAISSGSFRTEGMLVVPCSARSLASIAHGLGDSLVHRAADVVLKERRRLVLGLRETPLHTGHMRTMLHLSEIGAIVAPIVPAFYTRPKTLDEMVDHSIGRMLDLFGIDTGTVHRWKEPADPHPSGVRKKGRKTDEI